VAAATSALAGFERQRRDTGGRGFGDVPVQRAEGVELLGVERHHADDAAVLH
jgi:hypothetical protein